MQVEGQAHPSWIQAAPPSFATSPYYQEPLKSEITSTYQEFQVDMLEASQEVVEKKALRKAKIKVASFLLASFLILIFNIIILCIFPKGSDIFTPVVILRSNYAETRRFGFWIYRLINALATLLILGSNVGMQTAELLRKGRNPDFRGRRKIWSFLALTSLGVYLFYNSAVPETQTTSPFYLAVVGEEFLSSGPPTPPPSIGDAYSDTYFLPAYQDMRANGSRWDRLSNLECIQAYAAPIITDRRNLIIVTSNDTDPTSIYEELFHRLGSLPPNCPLSSLESNATNWTIIGIAPFTNSENELDTSPKYLVEYCLSEPINGGCWVGLNWLLLAIVTAFNAAKVVGLGICLREMFKKGMMCTVRDARSARRLRYHKPKRWIHAVSRRSIVVASYLTWQALVLGVLMLVFALQGEKSKGQSIDFSSLWKLGFGTVSYSSMIKGPSTSMNIISASILANIPQVVLAVLFFSYTYVLTEMVSFSYISKPSPTVKQLAEPAKRLPKYYSIVIAVALFVISVQISPYGDDTGSWFLNMRAGTNHSTSNNGTMGLQSKVEETCHSTAYNGTIADGGCPMDIDVDVPWIGDQLLQLLERKLGYEV
ncbi:hypothetical protein V8E51_004967 [Hyaloscypha variabilis]